MFLGSRVPDKAGKVKVFLPEKALEEAFSP